MIIELKHHFKDTCFDWNKILDDCDTFDKFCSRINAQSKEFPDRYDPNVYKGDGLELFCEYFLKTMAVTSGIYEYQIVQGEDWGVDGFGVGTNGNPATVQVKFRGKYDYELNANNDHLSNFVSHSYARYGVRTEDHNNMIIFSNAPSLNYAIKEKMYAGKVRFIGRDCIKKIVDKNVMFWRYFRKSINKSKFDGELPIPEKCRPKIKPVVLRQHQLECCNTIAENNVGQIILPTATGKSYIIAESIYREIKNNQRAVVVINTPRILLTFQLLKTVMTYLREKNIDSNYLNVNSGKFDDKEELESLKMLGLPYREINSTTSIDEIEKARDRSINENVPLIICSTYHSMEKINESNVDVDVVYFDEAHFLVSKQFSTIIDAMDGIKRFSFSATINTTDSDEGLGMNNSERFGEIIFSKSAKEMIEAGEMLRPNIHVINSTIVADDDDLADDYECQAQSIIEAYHVHSKCVKDRSAKPEMIGAKMLVIAEGQWSLKKFFETKKYNDFISKNPDIHLLAISSDFGNYIDGIYVSSKDEFLRKIQELPNEEGAIILHVDMLAEGIDVPGITGIMPFRNLGITKLVQTIGRASRLHPHDRERLYRDEIGPNDFEQFVKPCAWVIIPTYRSLDSEDRFKSIILRMRSEYGFIPEENVIFTDGNGIKDDEGIDGPGMPGKSKIFSKSGIESFIHSYEIDQEEDDMWHLLNKLKTITSDELKEWLDQR